MSAERRHAVECVLLVVLVIGTWLYVGWEAQPDVVVRESVETDGDAIIFVAQVVLTGAALVAGLVLVSAVELTVRLVSRRRATPAPR